MDVYFSEVAAESPLLTDGATASTSGEVQPSKRRRGDSQPQPQPQQLQQMISDPVVEIPRLSASVPLGTMLSGSGGQMGGVLPEMAFQWIRVALTWAGFQPLPPRDLRRVAPLPPAACFFRCALLGVLVFRTDAWN